MMKLDHLLICATFLAGRGLAFAPAAIYDGGFGDSGNSSILLNIGNGGAGQSGLVKGILNASQGGNTITERQLTIVC